mmetsp:Transcript_82310/g.233135  ORF Transcript_82310/g.233135 Transcript_82310/m.233135 type:complete len:228 (-) Transcript_82310:246-929(-)
MAPDRPRSRGRGRGRRGTEVPVAAGAAGEAPDHAPEAGSPAAREHGPRRGRRPGRRAGGTRRAGRGDAGRGQGRADAGADRPRADQQPEEPRDGAPGARWGLRSAGHRLSRLARARSPGFRKVPPPTEHTHRGGPDSSESHLCHADLPHGTVFLMRLVKRAWVQPMATREALLHCRRQVSGAVFKPSQCRLWCLLRLCQGPFSAGAFCRAREALRACTALHASARIE